MIRKTKIREVCKINGLTYSPKENWKFVNYLDTGNIINNKIESIQYIDPIVEKLPSRARRKVKNNNIIYSTVRPNQKHFGIIKSQPEHFLVSTGFAVLDVNENYLNPYYLYYLLTQNEYIDTLQALAEQSTSTYPSIKPSDIGDLNIEFPTLKIQNKIVNILNTIDKKIELNEEINKNLEQQAEAIFQSVLSNAITTVNLDEIADVKGGKRLPKGVNLIDKPNAHPYIRVRDLNNALFASLNPDYAYVDEETQKSISRYIVSTGDVLISIVGTIGLTAIVDSTLDKANLTENCVKITNLKHITPEYLLLYLRSQLGKEAIAKGTVGAVQQKLPIKNIQAIPIPLLSEKDKNALFYTLDSIFSGISNNVIQSTKLASLRDTLLPKLMSGELDVADINL